MPASPKPRATPTIVILGLLGCFSVALWGTYGLLNLDGTVQLMHDISKDGPPNLPGTNTPVKLVYTGIRPIDDQLAILDIFFWPVISGDHPDFSIHVYDFCFQFAVMYGICMIEGSRPGNAGRVISYIAIWGALFQNVAVANTLPLYFLLYLMTSPTVHTPTLSAILPSNADLISLPFSLLLGYFVPAFMMSSPSNDPSLHTQQNWMAVWQAFPLWVAIFQQIFPRILRTFREQRAGVDEVQSNVEALRNAYTFLRYLSTFGHVASWSLSLKSLTNPKLFGVGVVESLHPLRVWMPAAFLPSYQVPDIGTGANILLQYDRIVSTTATMIWAHYMYTQARRKEAESSVHGIWDFVKSLFTAVVIGPAGASVSLMESRDEAVFANAAASRKKVA